MKKLRRILAIPILILLWIIRAIEQWILLILCIVDVKPSECDFYFEDIKSMIIEWIKFGVEGF